MSGKKWTAAEERLLEEKWGEVAVPALARMLGRSRTAVIVRAQRIGLGAHLENDDRVSFNQIFIALYGKNQGQYTARRLQEHGFPIRYHRVNKSRFKGVDLKEFWQWAEEHKDLYSLASMEPGILGPEPEWVKDKRKSDLQTRRKIGTHNAPWTSVEDARLRRMNEAGKYTITEIAAAVGHSEGAVKRRISTIGLKASYKKREPKPWTDEEVRKLLELKEKGVSFEVMAEIMGRSALGIRGKYERLQNPEYMRRYYRGSKGNYAYVGIRDISPREIAENMALSKGAEFMEVG